jgi:hypothetical protein
MLADLFAQTGKDIEDEISFAEFAEMMTGGSSDMIEGDSSADPGQSPSLRTRCFCHRLHIFLTHSSLRLKIPTSYTRAHSSDGQDGEGSGSITFALMTIAFRRKRCDILYVLLRHVLTFGMYI